MVLSDGVPARRSVGARAVSGQAYECAGVSIQERATIEQFCESASDVYRASVRSE